RTPTPWPDGAYAKKARPPPGAPRPKRTRPGKRASLLLVAQTPDTVVAVLGDEEAAVRQLKDSDRPAPDLGAIRTGHPPGDDLLHRAGRFSVLERHETDRLTDALGAIPRAMEGEEGAVPVLGGEHVAGVEGEIEH